MKQRNVITRPYTVQQLAHMYGVSLKTLRKWFKPYREEIGQRTGHFYTVKQIDTIFYHIGIPPDLQVD